MGGLENLGPGSGDQAITDQPYQFSTADELARAAGTLGLLEAPRFFKASKDGHNYQLVTNCWYPEDHPPAVAFAVSIESQAPGQPEYVRSYAVTSGIFSVVSREPVFSIGSQGIQNYDLNAQRWLGASMRVGNQFPYIYAYGETGFLPPLVYAQGMYAKLGWHARRRYDIAAAREMVDVLSRFRAADEVENCMVAPWISES